MRKIFCSNVSKKVKSSRTTGSDVDPTTAVSFGDDVEETRDQQELSSREVYFHFDVEEVLTADKF